MVETTDRWAYLRKDLFRSEEPSVELVAVTQPVGKYKDLCTTETLPGFTARASHESKGTIEDDKRLNQDLIKWDHTTPLQAVQFVFFVKGITKSLQNQWVRHKIGVGWTFRSTRYIPADQNNFVYNTYDYVDDEIKVKELLLIDQETAKTAIQIYQKKRELGTSKEDSRKNMCLFFETPCYFYVNARALRHFFRKRLEKEAEWEIRRLAKLFLKECLEIAPSLFQDFAEKLEGGGR